MTFFMSLLSLSNSHAQSDNLIVLAMDWDLHIAHLEAPVVLFPISNSHTEELIISSAELALHRDRISDAYPGYEIRRDPDNPFAGSYRFTDALDKNYFLEALLKTNIDDESFRGPAFRRFYSALKNPKVLETLNIVTSRGHSPEQFLEGLKYLLDKNIITDLPKLENIHIIAYQYGPTAKLMAPDAKLWVLMDLLDNLNSKPLKAQSKAIKWNDLHYFEFSDDSYAYISHVSQGLMAEIQKNRWPNVNIAIRYSGLKRNELVHHNFFLLKDMKTRPISPDEESEINLAINPTEACDISLL